MMLYALLVKDKPEATHIVTAFTSEQALIKLQVHAVPGEVFACKVADATGVYIAGLQTGEARLKHLKLYSHSMQKIGDVT